MLRIKIPDQEAWEDLKASNGVSKFASILNTLRKVTKKLLREDDDLEFLIPRIFFSDYYLSNIHSFGTHLRRKVPYRVFIRNLSTSVYVRIRIGYNVEGWGFAKLLTQKLIQPEVGSVDCLKKDIPDSYLQNIHHLVHRLSRRMGCQIKRLDLVDTIRFYKVRPKQNK